MLGFWVQARILSYSWFDWICVPFLLPCMVVQCLKQYPFLRLLFSFFRCIGWKFSLLLWFVCKYGYMRELIIGELLLLFQLSSFGNDMWQFWRFDALPKAIHPLPNGIRLLHGDITPWVFYPLHGLIRPHPW